MSSKQFLVIGVYVSGADTWFEDPYRVDSETPEQAALEYEGLEGNDEPSPYQIWVCEPLKHTQWLKFRIETPPPAPAPPKKAVRIA